MAAANFPAIPQIGEFERMARRRYQHPAPVRRGNWWTIQVRKDAWQDGKLTRKNTRVRIAPASMGAREAHKVADEFLDPMNHNLESVGSATNFRHYVETGYRPTVYPLLASTTRDRTHGVLRNYLLPQFGNMCFRQLTPMALQTYFSSFAGSPLTYDSVDKIRDVLASVLTSARDYGLITSNPLENVKLPRPKRGKPHTMPYVTLEQFNAIVGLMPEPYATMVYVAVWTGLRVSELIGLRWEDINPDHNTITIDERYCRGDWSVPKSAASAAEIPVHPSVIPRIMALKGMTVCQRAGRGKRVYKVVKSDGPTDLVFQSLKDGKPMRDNNILTRHIKPAARQFGLDFVNWRCLRTSFVTWCKLAGIDVKDAQALARHARASTTLDVYMQQVPSSVERAVKRLGSEMIQ